MAVFLPPTASRAGHRCRSQVIIAFSPHAERQKPVELFLVKWRGLSYLHCSWESETDLMASEGTHIRQKLQVFFFCVYNAAFLPAGGRAALGVVGLRRRQFLQPRVHGGGPRSRRATGAGRPCRAVGGRPRAFGGRRAGRRGLAGEGVSGEVARAAVRGRHLGDFRRFPEPKRRLRLCSSPVGSVGFF